MGGRRQHVLTVKPGRGHAAGSAEIMAKYGTTKKDLEFDIQVLAHARGGTLLNQKVPAAVVALLARRRHGGGREGAADPVRRHALQPPRARAFEDRRSLQVATRVSQRL